MRPLSALLAALALLQPAVGVGRAGSVQDKAEKGEFHGPNRNEPNQRPMFQPDESKSENNRVQQ